MLCSVRVTIIFIYLITWVLDYFSGLGLFLVAPKYSKFHVDRNDSCLLTILIFDGISPLQFFDNLIISLASISPASMRVCVTVPGVWSRQMRIWSLPSRCLWLRVCRDTVV